MTQDPSAQRYTNLTVSVSPHRPSRETPSQASRRTIPRIVDRPLLPLVVALRPALKDQLIRSTH